jgi:hypothetical protein
MTEWEDSPEAADMLERMERDAQEQEWEEQQILADILAELHRAQVKFPSPAGCMTALTEEVGELAKALLDEPLSCVRAEAVQVAVMAIRVALEGDPTLANIRTAKGLA